MDKLVEKIASIGVPGLILLFVIGTNGLAGAAAITAGLAVIGPGGMVGGVISLLVIGAATSLISNLGFEAAFTAVVNSLLSKGESKESIVAKIKKYPLSQSLKLKLIDKVNNAKVGN